MSRMSNLAIEAERLGVELDDPDAIEKTLAMLAVEEAEDIARREAQWLEEQAEGRASATALGRAVGYTLAGLLIFGAPLWGEMLVHFIWP